MCDMSAVETHLKGLAQADTASGLLTLTRLPEMLADPSFRAGYFAFCLGLLILPMVALAFWYHARMRATPGGRRLIDTHGAALRRR